MPRALYTLLLRLWLPWHAVALWWRGMRNPLQRSSLRGHLALGIRQHSDRPLWLHAASVGEVQSLAAMLGLLHERMPGIPVVLTVGTATGLSHARGLYPAEAWPHLTLVPAPWDLPGAAQRFLAAVRPRAVVFVETELWPNLIAAARNQSLPLALASARVSARSVAGYRRWASALMSSTVQAFGWIGAQSDEDRTRFIELGCDPQCITVTGSLKFDLPLPADIAGRGEKMRSRFAPARGMWVAGSTHEIEEKLCLQAHRQLERQAREKGTAPPMLVLAPRRPERFERVALWLVEQQVPHLRFTSALSATFTAAPEEGVLLLDRMGELLAAYSAADAAFVGGSLVPAGGHNLLEPAGLAKPVIAGPHTFSSPEAGRLLERCGALFRVVDADTLAKAIGSLLEDPQKARAAGERAVAAVAANRGAAARTVEAITALAGLEALPESCQAPARAPSASG